MDPAESIHDILGIYAKNSEIPGAIETKEFHVGDFKEYKLSTAINTMSSIAEQFGIDPGHEDLTKTLKIIENAFQLYNGDTSLKEMFNIDPENIEYGFVVPARGEDAEEADTVMPIFKAIFEKANTIEEAQMAMQKMMGVLPPLVLAMYDDNNDPSVTDESRQPKGLLVYAPIPLDNLTNLYNRSKLEPLATSISDSTGKLHTIDKKNHPVVKIATKAKIGAFHPRATVFQTQYNAAEKDITNSVNEATAFLKRIAPNTKHIGLGAVLPALTNLGADVEPKIGVEVTTGHRMTLIGMQKTLEAVLDIDGRNINDKFDVGVIGSGYIGKAIANLTLEKFPNATITITDVIEGKLKKAFDELSKKYPNRVKMANTKELLESNKYVYSAVTSKIDLSDIDADALIGTIIIDDSEPSGFNPDELLDIGAIPLKPLFDVSQTGISRIGLDYATGELTTYNYGTTSGLDKLTTFFGCEAEALAAYLTASYHIPNVPFPKILVAGKKITPEMIAELGELPANLGIQVLAEMLQGQGVLRLKQIEDSADKRNPPPAT